MVRTRLYGTILAICVLLPLRLDARQLTVEDYYRVVAVQAPAMSPDGRWVAFVRSTIVEASCGLSRLTGARLRDASRIRH